MATIIQQAVKGKRKAMMQLYEANKQKVYYISLLLLGNEAEAAEAASFAFKNVWGGITAHAIASEREFTHLVIRRVADYCKKKICKQNPKAFRVPPNRNFLLRFGRHRRFFRASCGASRAPAVYSGSSQRGRIFAGAACQPI